MREFKVGDKVFSLNHGNGEVTQVFVNCDNYRKEFPLKVTFINGNNDDFTSDGKLFAYSTMPSLYHGHDLEVIVKEPEYEYQVIFCNLGKWILTMHFYKSIESFKMDYNSAEISECSLFEPSKRKVQS